MSGKIVIIGAGFAGVWSALSAKRLIDLQKKNKDIFEVTVIAPEPSLIMRPRLYEANPSNTSAPLGTLFESAGIKFVQAFAEKIDTEAHTICVRSSSNVQSTIAYDRLILAAGSAVNKPQAITGLQQHAFDIDSLDAAVKLETHLEQLASLAETAGRDTIIVCGAGFTGVELVTELPSRLAHMATKPRLIVVDSADVLGASLGPGPRSIITQAMQELGVEVKLGSSIASIDSEGVNLASGERIESKTVIWTAGVRATPLTEQIPGPKDNFARLYVDKYLRVASCQHVFATGDAAAAQADTEGHFAMMSCQHALQLGRVSGFNAAADLLGEPMVEYSQPEYVCCLDLGAWGTVISYGWDREVMFTGDVAKKVKRYINQKLIYPPEIAREALALAQPNPGAYSSKLPLQILQVVAWMWKYIRRVIFV